MFLHVHVCVFLSNIVHHDYLTNTKISDIIISVHGGIMNELKMNRNDCLREYIRHHNPGKLVEFSQYKKNFKICLQEEKLILEGQVVL